MNNRLKIAQLTYIADRDWGVGKYSWYLADNLRKLGAQVDVFSAPFHLKGLGPPLTYLRNMALRLNNYDLIHSNEGAGLLVRHPCMVETYHHDYSQSTDINGQLFDRLENIQCRRVQRIIVPSESTKKSLCSRGFSEKKVVAIHHGVDQELFKPNTISRASTRERLGIEDSFVVISVGRLIEHKKHIDIVKALSKIQGSVFILVGAGTEEGNILRVAKERRVRVLRSSNISDAELANLYRASDVYAHASALEGFGLTVLEAMSSGLPVVCYEAGDLRDVVSDSGFVLRQGDIEGLEQNLESLRLHGEERVAAGDRALKRSRIFSWDKSAQTHLEVFKEVCGEK